MTNQEISVDLFKKEARKIFAINAPILSKGVDFPINVAQYEEYKNGLEKKAMEISTPDIDDKIKTEIIESFRNELDTYIRNATKK